MSGSTQAFSESRGDWSAGAPACKEDFLGKGLQGSTGDEVGGGWIQPCLIGHLWGKQARSGSTTSLRRCSKVILPS